jgi:hypothetical protein
MSVPDFRDLCQQFVDAVDQLTSHGDSPNGPGHRLILTVDVDHLEELADSARAELAKEAAVREALARWGLTADAQAAADAELEQATAPSDEELRALYYSTPNFEAAVREALARWGLTADAQAAADAELEGVCSTILSQEWFADPTFRIAQLRRARRPAPAIPLKKAE